MLKPPLLSHSKIIWKCEKVRAMLTLLYLIFLNYMITFGFGSHLCKEEIIIGLIPYHVKEESEAQKDDMTCSRSHFLIKAELNSHPLLT